MHNFINPNTGKKHLITKVRTKVENGKHMYYDGYWCRLLDTDGTPLERIGSVVKLAVFTDEKKRI